MKAKLAPVYFETARDPDFTRQVETLRTLLKDEAEILEPVALGDKVPEADAVVFPQMLGNAYRTVEKINEIPIPRLVITSEFGTVSMWDWEINDYLRSKGIKVFAPYNFEQTKVICKALALKREMAQTRFIAYQDNPGEGFQASIFKRFYWWENECSQRMKDKFGIQILKKSFKTMGETAKKIPDQEAEAVYNAWQSRLSIGNISQKALYSAIKLYLAVKQDLDQDLTIKAAGINCLNESQFSDTTPCLAWNMLFEERELIWGCEADTVSMLTKYLIRQTLGVPVMMTNLYPFPMGMAAIKHERIPYFPEVSEEPENYILVAHCGYLGVLPQSFSTEWTLRKKVLAIVDENATAIDARLPLGNITLVKIDSTFEKFVVVEGELKGYAQFPGSDCLNGALIKVHDGHKLVNELPSHHFIITMGRNLPNIENIAQIFGMDVVVL
jgi:hypothetical protein